MKHRKRGPLPLVLTLFIVLFACLPAAPATTAQTPRIGDATAQPGPFDASRFSGSDICAKTNAAVVAAFASIKQPGVDGMAALRGRVRIPAGNYVCRTAIHVPHGVWISGDGDATFLQWAGSGPAVIVSDSPAPGEYVEGVLSDLHIRGVQGFESTSLTLQTGIFVGGDPACTNACTTNPATNVGYDYIVRNVTVLHMAGDGIEYGNNAFNLLWDNVHSNNNRGYGLYVPHTAIGGGQYNTWTHSQLAGNARGGWWIDQLPFVTFEMFAQDVQYNTVDDADAKKVPAHAEATGGHVICVGCHFEHQGGLFFSLNSTAQTYRSDDLQLLGGQLIAVRAGVTDAAMVLANGAARFSATGTYIVALHSVEELVSISEPAAASVSVFGSSVFSNGARFGGVTHAAGQGIRYEEPNVERMGGAAAPRYFGGVTRFDVIEAGTLGSEKGFSGTCATGVVVNKGIVVGCK